MIKKIRISNFKSFKESEIELRNLNILIGGNASGKSNFIQIFKFLHNAVKENLQTAIKQEGGIHYVKNINIGFSEDVVIKIDFLSTVGEKSIQTGIKIISEQMIGQSDISIRIRGEEIITQPNSEYDMTKTEYEINNPYFLNEIFKDIPIYSFNPKDRNDVIYVLNNIINNEDRKRKFLNFMQYLLPFIKDIKIDNKSLFFQFQKNCIKNQYLPVFLLSDGTINMIALIIALYFDEKSLIVIEEPERNIHPYLIPKVVEMMKEASQHKQIIVTTYSSEIVKYVDLEDILLMYRDKEGFSSVCRPCEKEEIKIFLKNGIGIEELYIMNLLGL